MVILKEYRMDAGKDNKPNPLEAFNEWHVYDPSVTMHGHERYVATIREFPQLVEDATTIETQHHYAISDGIGHPIGRKFTKLEDAFDAVKAFM